MFSDGLRCMGSLPCVYSVENLVPHDGKADEDFRVTQRIIDRCSGFITMSGAAEGVFRQYYRVPARARIFQVPHRNYIGIYPDGITRREARERLGIPEDARVLLSLGRIQPYKGLHQLIPAFLSSSVPGHILLIVGSAKSPGIIDQLAKLINQNATKSSGEVKIIDRFIEDADLQVYHRAADFAVFTYGDMPMNPGSLIMSMGFGLPAVAPLKGAIAETAGPEALIGYADANSDSLCDSIRRALSMPAEEILARGSKARDLVAKRNSLETASAAFASMYRYFSLI
jgi:glycosyltransferase involved in cell wall biosynthesis